MGLPVSSLHSAVTIDRMPTHDLGALTSLGPPTPTGGQGGTASRDRPPIRLGSCVSVPSMRERPHSEVAKRSEQRTFTTSQ